MCLQLLFSWSYHGSLLNENSLFEVNSFKTELPGRSEKSTRGVRIADRVPGSLRLPIAAPVPERSGAKGDKEVTHQQRHLPSPSEKQLQAAVLTLFASLSDELQQQIQGGQAVRGKAE